MTFEERYLALRADIMEKEFSRMNPMQRQAVFQTEGPVLILAGAGSGKTTVVVNRIANMIRYGNAYNSDYVPSFVNEDDLDFLQDYLDGKEDDKERVSRLLADRPVKPWNVLAITFTNKAAGELKERLEAILGEDAQDIQASTFHSACVRILRREITALGYESNFTIYDTDDSRRLMKACMKELNIDEKILNPKLVRNEISRAKDMMITHSKGITNVEPIDYMAPLIFLRGESVINDCVFTGAYCRPDLPLYEDYWKDLHEVLPYDCGVPNDGVATFNNCEISRMYAWSHVKITILNSHIEYIRCSTHNQTMKDSHLTIGEGTEVDTIFVSSSNLAKRYKDEEGNTHWDPSNMWSPSLIIKSGAKVKVLDMNGRSRYDSNGNLDGGLEPIVSLQFLKTTLVVIGRLTVGHENDGRCK